MTIGSPERLPDCLYSPRKQTRKESRRPWEKPVQKDEVHCVPVYIYIYTYIEERKRYVGGETKVFVHPNNSPSWNSCVTITYTYIEFPSYIQY